MKSFNVYEPFHGRYVLEAGDMEMVIVAPESEEFTSSNSQVEAFSKVRNFVCNIKYFWL